MSTTLSHGYKKPANPDTGDTFFQQLADDIQLMNDHIHDGNLGTILTSVTASIASGSWVAAPIGGGLYRQAVTMPTGYSYDSAIIQWQLSSGEVIYPTIERISSSSYYIYINDSSLTVTALYR